MATTLEQWIVPRIAAIFTKGSASSSDGRGHADIVAHRAEVFALPFAFFFLAVASCLPNKRQASLQAHRETQWSPVSAIVAWAYSHSKSMGCLLGPLRAAEAPQQQ
jgi:hypothetical protein